MPYIILGCALLMALMIIRFSLGRVSGGNGLEVGFATTAGNRELNCDESNWAYHQNQFLAAVADGIGQGPKGQTAAYAAVQTATRMFQITGAREYPAYFFRQTFRGANSTVLRYIPDGSCGASLLCALVRDGLLYYALAGNCRIAVYRAGDLIPLSEGHTVDVLARNAFQRKSLTRTDALEAVKIRRMYNYVGRYGFKDLELFDVPVVLKRGDIVVLMTSGVFDSCTTGYLEKVLGSRKNCESLAWEIISNLESTRDPQQGNATIVLLRVKEG